jgi:membrane protein DedA with SNARE-associated domain
MGWVCRPPWPSVLLRASVVDSEGQPAKVTARTLPVTATRVLSSAAPQTPSPRLLPALAPIAAIATAALPLDESPGGVLAYVTLGLSSILTEELSPIVGGVAASQRELGLLRVFIAVALGSWTATTLLYALGWWRGRWVRRRFPRINRPMVLMLRAVRKRPWRSALAVRWAFGARLLLPIACGASHLRLSVYLLGSALSSVVWSALFVGLGYAFGDTAVAVIGAVRRYDQWIVVGVALAVAIAWAIVQRRREAAEDLRAANATAELGTAEQPTAESVTAEHETPGDQTEGGRSSE